MWQVAQPAARNVFSPAPDSLFDHKISRNHAAGHRQGGLKNGSGCYVRAGHLVHNAIAIRVCTKAEALGGLNSMVMIKVDLRQGWPLD
jgi:hypothetical protein